MAQDNVQTKILEIEVNYSEALEKIAQYRIEVEKVKAKQKELKDALKEGRISQEEYHKSMESSKLMIGQFNAAIGTLTKQVKNQLKAQNEQSGSLVQWRAQLSNLTAEYDRLSKAEREGAKGKELKDKINEVTTALKTAEEETQRYYRNVGNYPQAMAPMKEQLDIIVAKLGEMKAAGLDTTPAFEEMQSQAESLRDKLAETSEESTASSDKMRGGINELVAVFAVWYTSIEGIGIKNESLNRTISVCVTGITAASTAGKIWNSVQKESALMSAAAATKTWLLNTALAAKITALTASTAATGKATIATKLWNAALYANPLVWLLGIVAAAVAAIYGLIKVFELFIGTNDEANKAVERNSAAIKSMEEAHRSMESYLSKMGASEQVRSETRLANLNAELEAMERNFEYAISHNADTGDMLEEMSKKRLETLESFEDGLGMLRKLEREEFWKEYEQTHGSFEKRRQDIENEYQAWGRLYNRLVEVANAQGWTMMSWEDYISAIKKRRERLLAEVDADEAADNKKKQDEANKRRQEAAKAAAEAAKKRQEEEKKREEEYYKEVEKAQDALLALIKDGLDKQLQAENLSYQRGLKALQDKLAKYKSNSEYDVKMRQALNDQIYALTTAHERRVAEFEWSEHERQLKIAQETLQSKLELIKKGTVEEMQERYNLLANEHQQEIDAIDKRIADGLLTQEQGNELKLNLEESYRKRMVELAEEYDQIDLARKKAALQAEIDAMQLAEDERQLKVREGYEMSDEAYAEWRERGLAGLEEHERNLLLKQEEAAQAELEALQARGQLSTQRTEEYEAEILAAKQKSQQAQANTNQAIIKDEQAKAQAMRSVTSSLTGLLDTLGESNKAFAKMSKIITLAQIAIDTGKALASGIASASSMPFPANLAAIATTVATILANVTTAISTVKSAKFAEGGKVTGPGTGTSDSIPAYLSNGEFVMTAQATKMFEPLLIAMNGIGKGVPMASPTASDRITTAEMMTDSFETAAREIRPVVSAVEITEVQNRVDIIENLDTFD